MKCSARTMSWGVALFALTLLLIAFFPGTSRAYASLTEPDNTQHTTVIYAQRVLTEMPSNFGVEVEIGDAYVTQFFCEGETYSRTEDIGHIWFTIRIPRGNAFLGNTSDIYLEHALMCIDRSLAAEGGASGSAQGWPITWTGEKTYGKLRVVLEDVDSTTGTATYTMTFYPTNAAGWTYQQLGYQRLRTQPYMKVVFPTQGRVAIQKVSANPSCTDGNPNYSLEGAVYGVYSDAACTDQVATLTTDASGNTPATDLLDGGRYYIKETSASKGYELDATVYPVDVSVGIATVTVKEQPILDPIIIRKKDAATGSAQGGATLAGAQFKVESYPAYFSSSSEISGTPTYTWIVQTDDSGQASLDDRISGDALIIGPSGNAEAPLGSLVVTEIQAPEGYTLSSSEPLIAQITESGVVYIPSGSNMTFYDDVKKGYISISKSLVNSIGATLSPARLEGIQVKVVSSITGNTVETLTLDAEGKATSGLLPYDTYKLIEVADSVPTNIEPWYITNGYTDPETPFATVDVHEDGATATATFSDLLMTGSAQLWKQSSMPDVTDGNSLYSVEGASYGLFADEACTDQIFTFHVGADGKTEVTDQIEAGTHLFVKELSGPTDGLWQISNEVIEITIQGGENVFEVTERPITGTFDLLKRDAETGATPQGDGTFEGTQIHVDYYEAILTSAAEAEGLTPAKSWDVTTDGTGKVTIGEALPIGSYVARETAAPYGYALSDDSAHLAVITSSGVTADEGNAIVFYDEAIKAYISVQKTLLNAGGSTASISKAEGIQVQVKDADGNLVDTLTLDRDGYAKSIALPVASYTLTEVASSVPAGIQPYSWTHDGGTGDAVFAAVSITPDDADATLETSFTDYTTTYVPVLKTDIDTGEGLPGATISLYKCPDRYITISDGVVTVDPAFDGSVLSNWEHVRDYTTDSDGYAGMSMAKFSLWCWAETKAPVLEGGAIVYLDEARTQDASSPIIHEMLIDKNHMSSAQSCADKRVDIAVKITERTIAITSAALDATGEEYDVNNVGTEGQWYQISAANNSSVDTENFRIEYNFDDIRAHGGKVITVLTPTTTGDKDGSAVLYYATTDAPGTWVKWADVSATSPARFDVSSLGGAELAGIKIDYGKVTKDMTVGTQYSPANSNDLCFEIVYTEALAPGATILHSCDVYTDLSVSSETTIWAVDDANVKTTVIYPKTLRSSFNPNGGWTQIATGDFDLILILAAIAAAAAAIIARRLRRDRTVSEKTNLRAPAAALAAVAAFLVLAMVPAAYADTLTLEKPFTYMEGEQAPVIAQTMDEDGITYTLDSVSEPVADPTFTPATRPYKRTVEGNFATLDEARAAYAESIEVTDDDGYTGTIPQTDFKSREIWGTYTQVQDVQKTFGPFPTNDVSQLEGLIDFDYSAPEWTPVEYNSVGMPTSYTVTVTCKEAASSSVQTGYSVTVTYEGTLTSPEKRYVVTATYTAPEPEVAPEPEPEPEPAEPARNGLSGGALAGIIGGAAALIIGGFLIIPPILGRRLKFRLTETVAGRERKVSDIPCSAKDGLIDVELPAGLDFANHDYHGTFLPGSTAKKDVMVSFYTVTNGERQELRPAAKIAPEYTFSNITH